MACSTKSKRWRRRLSRRWQPLMGERSSRRPARTRGQPPHHTRRDKYPYLPVILSVGPVEDREPTEVTSSGTWTRTTRELRPGVDLEPPVLDFPPPNGAAEPPGSTMPEQIQAPTQVERLSESLRGKKSQRATWQESQVSARVLEGKTALGVPHGRPPDPTDSQPRGSAVLERRSIDPKVLSACIRRRGLSPMRVRARTSMVNGLSMVQISATKSTSICI